MKVFVICSNHTLSDYWKTIVIAENSDEAIEIVKSHYGINEEVLSIKEIKETVILYHESYMWG